MLKKEVLPARPAPPDLETIKRNHAEAIREGQKVDYVMFTAIMLTALVVELSKVFS